MDSNRDMMRSGVIHIIDQELFHRPTQRLTLFLSLLKFARAKRPYKFTFVPSTPQILKKSDLRENLLIDSSFIGLGITREDELKNHMNKSENFDLKDLFKTFSNITQAPHFNRQEAEKLSSLLISLIRPAKYLFLESPELNVSKELFSTYQKALLHESKLTGKVIVVATDKSELWSDFSQVLISQEEKNRNFYFKPLTEDGVVIPIDSHQLTVKKRAVEILKKAA